MSRNTEALDVRSPSLLCVAYESLICRANEKRNDRYRKKEQSAFVSSLSHPFAIAGNGPSRTSLSLYLYRNTRACST